MRGETTGTLNYAFDRASMRLKRKKYDKTVTECLNVSSEQQRLLQENQFYCTRRWYIYNINYTAAKGGIIVTCSPAGLDRGVCCRHYYHGRLILQFKK